MIGGVVLKKSVFKPVVDTSKMAPGFKTLLALPESHPSRMMLDEIYSSFEDSDGNFLEQFQTTGFDARYFELYLFAYFLRTGFEISKRHSRPDFVVNRSGLSVAVEATTTNPSISGPLSRSKSRIGELDENEMREYVRHELAIRFGSPLYSKLKKKYWELEHCKELPIVLAIEAFHEAESLALSDSALTSYVFGLDQSGSLDPTGELEIETTLVESHQIDGKEIPSNFFAQEYAENISAIIFTNSGTNAKFSRMGYQQGYGCDRFMISRMGNSYSPDPNALDPTLFSYNLDEPPFVEPWGQGLVVLHNPYALHPLPHDFFPYAVPSYIENGVHTTEHSDWHPFSSKTLIWDLHKAKKELEPYLASRLPRRLIEPITQLEFFEATEYLATDAYPGYEEQGWFADDTESFFGAVIENHSDGNWGALVLARDQGFVFRPICTIIDLPSRGEARTKIQQRIAELLCAPQRVFVKSD